MAFGDEFVPYWVAEGVLEVLSVMGVEDDDGNDDGGESGSTKIEGLMEGLTR